MLTFVTAPLKKCSIFLFVCFTVAGISIWNGNRRTNINLQEERSSTTKRSSNWIIGFEVFACLILITAAVLDIMGFEKLAGQPSGFGSGDAVLVSLTLRENSSRSMGVNDTGTAKERRTQILDLIRNSPGVQSVAAINVSPLTNSSAIGTAEFHGADGGVQKVQIWPAEVSVGYFSSSGTRIIRGRDFVTKDLAGDSVCILSSRVAAKIFPGVNPLEKYLYVTGSTPCRVIGIAENAHFKSISDDVDAIVYRLSKDELPNIIVKAATSALAIQAVRSAIQSIAPDALPVRIETIQMYIQDDLRKWKIIMLAGTFCAAVGAAILGIGFFGILSLQVAERKREIGVQIALGANRIQVCLSVIRKMRKSLLLGLAFGSVGALYIAAELKTIYLLNTSFAIEGYCFSLALLILLLIAAAFVPIHHALEVSPMECLTSE